MCSILAYCSSQADPQLVAEMLAKTITRGPDDTRITETGNGFLGFNRLSIMGSHRKACSPLCWVIMLWSATENYTDFEKCGTP